MRSSIRRCCDTDHFVINAVVWVPDPNLIALGSNDDAALSVTEQADLTLNSLEDFVPEHWGLPPYDS